MRGTREKGEPALPGTNSSKFIFCSWSWDWPLYCCYRQHDGLLPLETEGINIYFVCKEHLKLDGAKCVDFMHFSLAPSNKGGPPVKQHVWALVSRPPLGHLLLAAVPSAPCCLQLGRTCMWWYSGSLGSLLIIILSCDFDLFSIVAFAFWR